MELMDERRFIKDLISIGLHQNIGKEEVDHANDGRSNSELNLGAGSV
jgi:hypothetical protein